jgi:hypothetical protein
MYDFERTLRVEVQNSTPQMASLLATLEEDAKGLCLVLLGGIERSLAAPSLTLFGGRRLNDDLDVGCRTGLPKAIEEGIQQTRLANTVWPREDNDIGQRVYGKCLDWRLGCDRKANKLHLLLCG